MHAISNAARFAAVLTLLSVAAVGVDAQPSFPLKHNQFVAFDLKPDQLSGQGELVVESSDPLRAVFTATEPNVVVSIEGPDGRVVNRENVEALGGAFQEGYLSQQDFSLEGDVLPGYRQEFEFPSSGPGRYVFRAEVEAAPEGVGLMVQLQSIPKLVVNLLTQAEHPVGASIPLGLVVIEGGFPVKGMTAVAEVRNDSGVVATIRLLDGGEEGDTLAGDGFYCGLFVPKSPGAYVASARVTGVLPSGDAIERTVSAEFWSLGETGRLTGAVRDRGVDNDQDGFIDELLLEVEVDVSTPGEYGVSGTLESPNGETSHFHGRADGVAAGNHWIPVRLSLADLRQLGPPGPYGVNEVTLTYLGPDPGSGEAHKLSGLGQTGPYPASEVQQPAVAFQGFSEAAVDEDGDGTFDKLVVVLNVEVFEKGLVNASLELQSADGTIVERADERDYLDVGVRQMRIEFFGPAIRKAGEDGPFKLVELHVGSRDDGLTVSEIGSTQGYRSEQFRPLAPKIKSVDPSWAQPGEEKLLVLEIPEMELATDSSMSPQLEAAIAATLGPGARLPVKISSNPRPGQKPKVTLGAGIDVIEVEELLIPGKVDVRIRISPDAALGPRDIRVEFESGAVVVGSQAFSVLLPKR